MKKNPLLSGETYGWSLFMYRGKVPPTWQEGSPNLWLHVLEVRRFSLVAPVLGPASRQEGAVCHTPSRAAFKKKIISPLLSPLEDLLDG